LKDDKTQAFNKILKLLELVSDEGLGTDGIDKYLNDSEDTE
jgi:hypothetical protein